ncbi:hypothetical protein [Rhizobium sp. BK060]|uniref:hypothetical protein n=1 Tax=Rhizobium sp. BK060 TaxID=2587096 RepID=UPI00161F19D6|nr:hypothetical protein [Rhizobium sp. BK060]MBB3396886.1 hypothetical protein [Rhizobium sp. BK060]
MRRVFKAAGAAVAIASVAFVVRSIWRSYSTLPEAMFSGSFIALLVVLAAGYAGVNQLLGSAWYSLLSGFDRGELGLSGALAIFNRTQIYKYLPGNVFHMVGRYSMAKKEGVSHGALSVAQFGELALVCIAAVLVAGVSSLDILTSAAQRYGFYRPIYAVAFILAMGLASLVAVKVAPRRLFRGEVVRSSALALSLYLLFVLGNSLMAVAVALWIGAGDATVVQIIAVASTAWLFGFIVPGAPGGLGAREAVTIAGLTALGVPVANATAIAISHRLVTLAGDSIAALSAFVVRVTRR